MGFSDAGIRLMAWISTHEDSFKLSRPAIMNAMGFSDHKARRAIDEAKTAGYMRTVKARSEVCGTYQTHYEISTSGLFSTSGKPPFISSLQLPVHSATEAAFLAVFPNAPKKLEQFRHSFAAAVRNFGLDCVIEAGEAYGQEVASRTKGGRVATPENWLWRLNNPNADDVIDNDPAKHSNVTALYATSPQSKPFPSNSKLSTNARVGNLKNQVCREANRLKLRKKRGAE